MSLTAEEIDFLTFDVSGTICGMNLLDIQEINKASDITRVPRTPEFVEGIINLRSNIVTIINMGIKLGLKPVEKKKENQIIILIIDDEYIGLMIDDVSAVIRSCEDDIESAPGNLKDVQADYFKCVLKNDSQLTGILDIQKVLS